MKLNELLHKKVISVDGKELGLISDMELDQCLCVKTIYVCEIKRGIARFCHGCLMTAVKRLMSNRLPISEKMSY